MIWIIFQCATAWVLVFPMLSFIWYKLKRKMNDAPKGTRPEPDFGIIVTAYKFTGNLPYTINSLLNQQYEKFHVYVVADNCGDEDIFPPHPNLTILRPEPVLANQIRSHFYAINNFIRNHDAVTIIDSDNLAKVDYLEEISKWLQAGFDAVQGVRRAKNINTSYASVDALNELYYLFYDRKILFNIGSSCLLSGSGMAFTTTLYRECLEHCTATGAGFDKILQKEIVMRKHRIAFAGNAIVFDEKTATADQLVKQRARWNNTWLRFLKFGFILMWEGLKNANLNQFLVGTAFARPPMFILLIVSAAITFIQLLFHPLLGLAWMALLGIFILGFFVALNQMGTEKQLYRALQHIPKFFYLQIVSLFKAKNANKLSVSTEHSVHKELDEIKNEAIQR